MQGGDSTGRLNAGLPNIVGLANNCVFDNAEATGAFYVTIGGESGRGLDGLNKKNLNFDASRSNSIYGSSQTVQPPAILLIPQIKF